MASNFKLSSMSRAAACSGILQLVDSGGGGARIEIRSGAPPTNVWDASTGTLLATPTFGYPGFGTVSNGSGTANAITSATAVASADAGYFRVYASGGGDTAALFQGTAGNSADTPDMIFDNKAIVSGGTVAIVTFSLGIPIQ